LATNAAKYGAIEYDWRSKGLIARLRLPIAVLSN
jgi:hypothetical protein